MGIVLVHDMTGLSLTQMHAAVISAAKQVIMVDNEHYPGTLRKSLVINTPKKFHLFWQILKPFMDPNTLEKVEVYGNDSLPILKKYIPFENIPRDFGGGCQNHSQCVPGGGNFNYYFSLFFGH